MFIKLALKSLAYRKSSVIFSLLAMTISIFVLLGVTHIRHQVKVNFSNTVAGIDLIVGARTGQINLLLYTVFGVGTPTDTMDWHAFEKIADNPAVKWAVPISLGDSHKGYRVLGTTKSYFQHYRYGNQRPLLFAKGNAFKQTHELVIGADVAKQLRYQLGSKLTLAHGLVSTGFNQHNDHPFEVVGILSPTGTPVDQSVIVSLASLDAVHEHWHHDRHTHDESMQTIEHHKASRSLSAALLGLKSKHATLTVQRNINQNKKVPLTAIVPGVALSELWKMMRVLENALTFVSVFVFIAAILGVGAMLFASIREREQEMRLLRVMGASPSFLFMLIELEALLMMLLSMLLASGLLILTITIWHEKIVATVGLHLSPTVFNQQNWLWMVMMVLTTLLVAAIPAISVYRKKALIQ